MNERIKLDAGRTMSGRLRALFGIVAGVLLASTVVVVAPIVVAPTADAAPPDSFLSLDGKTVAPLSSLGAPLLPSTNGSPTTLTYTITYSCSGLVAADCAGLTFTDTLPTFTDIYGNPAQLNFASASAFYPTDVVFNGVSGASPTKTVSWTATSMMVAGDSGSVTLSLTVPQGIVPFTPQAQQVSNTAVISSPCTDTDTVHCSAGPAVSYINALPAQSGIFKTGPSTALLNAAGTDPVAYTVKVCPQTNKALWDSYTVTDVLPVGATPVGPLPFGGVYTPGTPSTMIPDPIDPLLTIVQPGTGGTIVWNLHPAGVPNPGDPANLPATDAQGCLPISFNVTFVNMFAGGDLTNVIGETKTNSVSAVGSNSAGGGPQNIGPATTTLTLIGPITRFGPSKNASGNYYVQNGDTVTYSLGASNTSDAEAHAFTTATLSDGPFPTGFTLTQINTGTWSGAPSTVSASIETSPDNSTWTQVSTAPGASVTTGLAGVNYVRWVFTGTIGSGWSASGQKLIGTITGTPPSVPPNQPGIIRQNCVTLTGEQDTILQDRGRSCASVQLETPQPHPSITKTSPVAIDLGATVTYTLTASNNSDSTGDLVNPRLTDCVPDSSRLVVSNLRAGGVALPAGGWTLVALTPGGCTPEVLPSNTSAQGPGTLITLQYTGTLTPGQIAPAITYDVTADGFQTPTVNDTPALPGSYTNVVHITQADGSQFNHCVQAGCKAAHSINVNISAQLRSQKLVQGALDAGFNLAGTTVPGGHMTWKISVQNVGNVQVDQVQYVDILPFVGDVGVRLSTVKRGSEFTPYLVSLITAPPGWTVEYSLSNKPCRPEVLGPTVACDVPNWTASPTVANLPLYRSIRLTYPGRLDFGQSLSFEYEMVTPVFDPTYTSGVSPYDRLTNCTIPVTTPPYAPATGTGGPGNTTILGRTEVTPWVDANGDGVQQLTEGGPTCPRASNSFAYGVHVPDDQLGGLSNPGRLGAEPPKVDIHVAAPAQSNSIGDRVWYDKNYNGIQDSGETGATYAVSGVYVELYKQTSPGVFIFYGYTYTDVNGNYLFSTDYNDPTLGLPAGDYKVRFYPPTSWYISPQDADGLGATDLGTPGNGNTDSDIPQTSVGTGTGTGSGAGNGLPFYETTVVNLGSSGSEADLSWDAGLWKPQPTIKVNKVTKDTAWPDSQAGDGVSILRGRPVTWLYTVTNTGNTRLESVSLTDNGGPDPTFTVSNCSIVTDGTNASGLSSSPAAPIALNRGAVMTCTATSTAKTVDYSNIATVSGTPVLDSGTALKPAERTPVSATDPSSYFSIRYDLALVKTVNTTNVLPLGTATFTILVQNQGGVASGVYDVTDTLPAGVSYVLGSASPSSPTVGSGTLTWTGMSNLAPGGSATITFTAQIDDWSKRPYRNFAEISDDSSELVTTGGVLTPTTDSDSTPDTVTTNDGTYPAIGATPGTGIDNLTIADAGVRGGDPQDDADIADINPVVTYDLALAKVVTNSPIAHPNGPVFTIRVYNQGNVPSRAVTVKDQMPTGTTFDAVNSAATCTDNLDTVSCSIANIPIGGYVDVKVALNVTDWTSGPWRNWAEINTDSSAYYFTNDIDSTPASQQTGGIGKDNTPPPNEGYTGVIALGATYTAPNLTDEDDNDDALALSLVSIGDYVWLDVNRNGQQGTAVAEPPIVGMTVNLYLASAPATIVKTTSTNAQGYYSFTDLAPSTNYIVEFVKPDATYGFTSQFTGATATDSNANTTTGRANVITAAAGANSGAPNAADDSTIDAGLVKVDLAIAKVLNTDGLVYPGNTVTFTLTPNNNGTTAALTGWKVTEIMPARLTLVSMVGSAGGSSIYTCVSNVCTSGAPLAAGATAETIIVTATVNAGPAVTAHNVTYVSPGPGEVTETIPLVVPTTSTNTSTTSTNNDAQADVLVTPLVSVGDYVWFDLNRDGLQTGGEAPVSGVTVELLDASGNSIDPPGVATQTLTTTNVSGFYSFTGLLPSTNYQVKFTAPSGDFFTSQSGAVAVTNNSDADVATGVTAVFTTPADGSNASGTPDFPAVDAGLVRVDLAVAKAITSAGPYYEGSTVTFALTPTNVGSTNALAGWSVTDVLPVGLTATGIVGAAGGSSMYTCVLMTLTCTSSVQLGIAAAGEQIIVTTAINADFVGSAHNVAYVSPASSEVTEVIPLITPTTSTNTSTTPTNNDAQATVSVDSLVSIGDYVWLDVNRDGVQGAAEPAMSGVTVQLYNSAGTTLLRTTTTDGSGFYFFDDLSPSAGYQVKFIAPTNYSFTTQFSGTAANDSNANRNTGFAGVTTPPSGSNAVTPGNTDEPTIDAGFVNVDLTLAKVLDTPANYYPGKSIQYTLTPSNVGTTDALAGWKVTEILPAGMTLVSMVGSAASSNYTCVTNVCTSWAVLPAGGAAGETIIVTATINANITGTLHNVAYISPATGEVIETNPLGTPPTTSTDTSDTPTNNDAQADLTANIYDLALAKTGVVNGTGGDSTVIDFTVTVRNQGTVDSGNYTVVDKVPAGLAPKTGISNAGVYNSVAGTVTWTLSGLAAGSTLDLIWSATVSDFSKRPFRNFAEVATDGGAQWGGDNDSTPDTDTTNDGNYGLAGVDNATINDAGQNPDPEDDADIADVNVALAYDLALAKVPNLTSITPSGAVTFTLTVENQGDVNSGSYTVTDTLPIGTAATAASDGGLISGSTVTWSLSNLAAGAVRSVTVTVGITDVSKRPFKNIAEISADGADAYDAPGPGGDVEDADSIPDGVTTNDNGGGVSDGYGTWEHPTNDLSSIADASPNGEDDADVAFFDAPVLYDLALIKTGPGTIDGAGLATFTIDVKNQGNVGSGNFTVRDVIPDGLTATTASNGGDIAGQIVTWNLSGLAAGATTSVTVTVRVADFSKRPWLNVAEISADGADIYDTTGYEVLTDGDVEDDDSVPDSNPSNDVVVDQKTMPATQHNDPTVDEDDHDVASLDAVIHYDLALVKNLPAGQSFKKDSNISFEILIKNQGNVNSGEFTVQDVIPAGLTFVSATDNPLVAGQTVIWDLTSLAPGEIKSVTIVVKIVDITLDSYVNLAEIVTDGADTYDLPGQDVEDEDSIPDADVYNDPIVDNDDVNIDNIPGDEDDHDRSLLDPAKVKSDNPKVTTAPIPATGGNTLPQLYGAAAVLGIGALAQVATRRRRRRTT